MADSFAPYSTGSFRAPRRAHAPTSPSPSRSRLGDDLLHMVTPHTAVDLFRSPPPQLKASMTVASASDQAFALRAAVASRKIQDWLDELSEWHWPTEGGSAGFEMPESKRRKLEGPGHSPSTPTYKALKTGSSSISELEIASDDPDEEAESICYMGCLREKEVAAYERRVDEIDRDMKELDVEEIKCHVLHNHIRPLSRPGTPFSDTKSNISVTSVSRMDDLTAVITAIVMQALPNLSKLARLMNVWSTRLAVLVRIPGFLNALEAAEVAMRSAWNAISLDTKKGQAADDLTKEDFAIMNNVLLPRVSKAGRELDRLLDILEGVEDTIPESWIDRMDAVERGSGEWVAASEQKIRESYWTKILEVSRSALKPSRTLSLATTLVVSDRDDTVQKVNSDSSSAGSIDEQELRYSRKAKVPGIEVSHHEDGVSSPMDPGSPPLEPVEYSVDESLISEILACDNDLAVLEEEDEEQPLPDLRHDSGASAGATALRHHQPFASDNCVREGTPELPRQRHREEGFTADDVSLPSSPPLGTKPSRHSPFREGYLISRPRTPIEDQINYAQETVSNFSPRTQQDEPSDAQLQQQISEILESIPAKIRLAAEPASAATLNPPELPIQRIKQKKNETGNSSSQTTSSLSSRAVTPSFTLAPAFARPGNSRPSRTRGNPDVKLYHLSRSSGEAPKKLFIRCVGERGERVMVRIGGGWADLGEYLKEYATHHRRSGAADSSKVEVRGINDVTGGNRPPSRSIGSSPPSRPGSSLGVSSPITPLVVRKTRRSVGAGDALPRTALTYGNPNATADNNSPPGSFAGSNRSRSSSWSEEESSLGLAGPTGRRVEMSEESRAWVESVKEKVRLASGERKFSGTTPNASFTDERAAAPTNRSVNSLESRFGEMGKVGSTKRIFRKSALGN